MFIIIIFILVIFIALSFLFGPAGVLFGAVVTYSVFLVNSPGWTLLITVAAVVLFFIISYLSTINYKKIPERIAKRFASSQRQLNIPLIFGFKFGMTREEVKQRADELVSSGVLYAKGLSYYYQIMGQEGKLQFVYDKGELCELHLRFEHYVQDAALAIMQSLSRERYKIIHSLSNTENWYVKKNVVVCLTGFCKNPTSVNFFDMSVEKRKIRNRKKALKYKKEKEKENEAKKREAARKEEKLHIERRDKAIKKMLDEL